MYSKPKIVPLGDSCVLVQLGDTIDLTINQCVHALSRLIEAAPLAGINETVPAYATLVIHYDPAILTDSQITAWVSGQLDKVDASSYRTPRQIEVPVRYGGASGPDLELVAASKSISPADVIRLHSQRAYTVYMMGFTPGFPYMGTLDERLRVPRLETPRTRVKAGTVAIAGEQTGIYPLDSPGGWQLLGWTPLKLFDPNSDIPFLFAPGDEVRFVQSRDSMLEILEAGGLLTVQDGGRRGWQKFGVPICGPMDWFAHRAANALVGNEVKSAALEIGFGEVTLRALRDCVVAVTGLGFVASTYVWTFPLWNSFYVRNGWTIRVTKSGDGNWAYLAFAGGIEVEPALGSRSTYARAGLGKNLEVGDILKTGKPTESLEDLAARTLPPEIRPNYSQTPIIEAIQGPQSDWFTQDGLDTFYSCEYSISMSSDRMGYRLDGSPISSSRGADLLSEGMTMGSIQVPANGQPIVMMADCGTTGGYPKIANVIKADLPVLAQVTPRTGSIRFKMTTVEEAQQKYRKMVNETDHGIIMEEDDSKLME